MGTTTVYDGDYETLRNEWPNMNFPTVPNQKLLRVIVDIGTVNHYRQQPGHSATYRMFTQKNCDLHSTQFTFKIEIPKCSVLYELNHSESVCLVEELWVYIDFTSSQYLRFPRYLSSASSHYPFQSVSLFYVACYFYAIHSQIPNRKATLTEDILNH